MTIDLHATHPATAQFDEELLQFVFRSAIRTGLVSHAREMLAAAPRELAASFEQAVRASDLAS